MNASPCLKFSQWFASCVALCGVGACTTTLPGASTHQDDVKWQAISSAEGSSRDWQHKAFPGKKKTLYKVVWLNGRQLVQSESDSSASMLRQALHLAPEQLGTLRFSWKVASLIPGADMSLRDADDSPVRIILAFDGERSSFSAKNAMLSELALALTGEAMPYATLMYVWDNHSPAGSVLINTRTDRVRKLVLESGPANLNRWQDYERDIRADYQQAFGEAPGALVGIGIMTDSDNTRQKASAWFGPLSLTSRPVKLAADNYSPAPDRP